MRIKKNDIVQVISGKDRGKSGKVVKVLNESNRAIVEGVNVYKKHSRPKKQGQKGEIVSLPRPIQSSNILPWCSNCGKGVRVGFKFDGNKKNRFCKKCQKTI